MSTYKHNKKRNTAFLYQVLLREMAEKSFEDKEREVKKVEGVVKKFFSGTELSKELDLYNTLLETRELDEKKSERLIQEVKEIQEDIDNKKVFNLQTKLINEINNKLSPSIFSNFIKNYRSLATVYQFLNRDKMSAKQRVQIQEDISESLQSKRKKIIKENLEPVDELTYKMYIKKFNEKYSPEFNRNQKKLLGTFIMNGPQSSEMKYYLNEEMGRLKNKLREGMEVEEIQEDEEMQEKAEKIIELLESYNASQISEDEIKIILETQGLVEEIFDTEPEKEEDNAD